MMLSSGAGRRAQRAAHAQPLKLDMNCVQGKGVEPEAGEADPVGAETLNVFDEADVGSTESVGPQEGVASEAHVSGSIECARS